LSPFRPRRWRGAILSHEALVRILVNDADKRPVSAVADHQEIRDVASVDVEEDSSIGVRLLFDKDHSLAERVLAEQFRY
jgi:NAD+ kinase